MALGLYVFSAVRRKLDFHGSARYPAVRVRVRFPYCRVDGGVMALLYLLYAVTFMAWLGWCAGATFGWLGVAVFVLGRIGVYAIQKAIE